MCLLIKMSVLYNDTFCGAGMFVKGIDNQNLNNT